MKLLGTFFNTRRRRYQAHGLRFAMLAEQLANTADLLPYEISQGRAQVPEWMLGGFKHLRGLVIELRKECDGDASRTKP
jgi:hypothetical protein